jgi:hypothetical protein
MDWIWVFVFATDIHCPSTSNFGRRYGAARRAADREVLWDESVSCERWIRKYAFR